VVATRESRWWVDVRVVAAVAALTGADAAWNAPGTRAADGWTFVLVMVSAAVLFARRRWPVMVVLVCTTALTVLTLLGHRGELLMLPAAAALYAVVVYAGRRRAAGVCALVVAWLGLLGWLAAGRSGAPVTEVLWPVAAVLLAETVRARRCLSAEYAARETLAVVEREREAQQRVEQERLRIAREFHDVVAHTMTAVHLQMSVAATAFDQAPDAARSALAQARSSSRNALQELRAAVAMLREAGPGEIAVPAPGLGQLDELVEYARGTGLNVTVHCTADAGGLPAGVGLAGYRIVQEALTNVIRHAHAGTATVSVSPASDAVCVEVTDDGSGAGSRPGVFAAAGHGVAGMVERAAALGGSLEWGPRPEGGFRVRAVLPVPGGPR
jgi:signal transduction histidine kinase